LLFNGEQVDEARDTFIYSSLWVQRQLHGLNIRPKIAVQLLLLLAGDVETLQAPTLKCNTCLKRVKIVPISKSDDNQKSGNYRLISLLSNLNRIFKFTYVYNSETKNIY
jgi:hypothetical protein